MERICFTMRVAAEHIDHYVAMHATTWPELLSELHRTGWENYSLFLRDDGYLVGYLETPDWTAAQRGMSLTDVAPRWSVEMDRLVVPGTEMTEHPVRTTLESALGLAPVRGARKHCATVTTEDSETALRALNQNWLPAAHRAGHRNLSVIVPDPRTLVLYGEYDLGEEPEWPSVPGGRLTELRQVFDLGAQLQRAQA